MAALRRRVTLRFLSREAYSSVPRPPKSSPPPLARRRQHHVQRDERQKPQALHFATCCCVAASGGLCSARLPTVCQAKRSSVRIIAASRITEIISFTPPAA